VTVYRQVEARLMKVQAGGSEETRAKSLQ
jgi:hypothetical protein